VGKLSGAIPREYDAATAINSPKGAHNSFFVGVSDPYEWVSPFGDACKLCEGNKHSKFNPGMPCTRCGGSGVRTEQHIKLHYQLENGVAEIEEANYSLRPPGGMSKSGQPMSATTFYLRLSEFSGLQNASAQQLVDWFDQLREPIRIPVLLIIGMNQTNSALKIIGVQARTVYAPQPNGAYQHQPYQPAPPSQPPPPQFPPQQRPAAPPQQHHRPVEAAPPYNGSFTDPRASVQYAENALPYVPEGQMVDEHGVVMEEIPY
jgi:hypothetical protein